MARKSKAEQGGPVVVWTRLDPADVEELRRREAQTGATVSAQVRVIVHAWLKGPKTRRVIK